MKVFRSRCSALFDFHQRDVRPGINHEVNLVAVGVSVKKQFRIAREVGGPLEAFKHDQILEERAGLAETQYSGSG